MGNREEAFGIWPGAFFGVGRVVCSKSDLGYELPVEVVLMKRRVVIALLALSVSVTNFCAAADVRPNNSDPFTWQRISRSEWRLEFTLPQLAIDSVELSGAEWADVHALGLPVHSTPGLPALPFVSIWIPAEVSTGDFELITDESRVIRCAHPLPAPQNLDRAVQSSLTYLPNEDAYTQSSPSPGSLLDVIHVNKLGRSDLTQVIINPLQYTATSGTLLIHERVLFRVTLPRGQSLDNRDANSGYEEQFISDLVRLPPPTSPPSEINSARMWIVTEQDYVESLTEWRAFKRACGIPTEIVLYSDVATSAAGLKSYLQSRYNDAESPPEYLLIVGDHQDVPAFYGVGSSLTDHPYSCLAGNDFLSDIAVGRLPIGTVTQLSHWLNRALTYERDGQASLSNDATVFSSSVALDPTHGQRVHSLFMQSGLNSTRLQQPQTGALPLFLSAINAQPLWTFYIGHGNATAWSSVAPHFTESSLPDIQDSRPAMVVSVACATADFDESQNCIAEEWTFDLLSGGALCYVGATESTAFFYSDTIGLATLDAVFERGYTSIGKALDYGRLRCATAFPQSPGGLTEETIQQFILLGDPSLMPYTLSPRAASVSAPQVLPVGTTHIPITVTANGQGVENVNVTLSSATVPPRFVSTNEEGFALVALPFTTEHEWTLVVRGANIIPVVRTISVVPVAGPLVQLQTVELDESIGDMDANPDRGESGTLRVLLRNAGTANSLAGTLRLECSSSALSVTPTTLPLPSLAPQTEDWLDATAQYAISPTVSHGTAAVVQAWIGSGVDAVFAGSRTIQLNAPRIELDSQYLTELEGDGDGQPEAGELVKLSLVVINQGGEPMRQPVADCSPDHNYLHIQNNRWLADSIDAGQTDTISYVFTCDSVTPRGFAFEYNVSLSAGNSPAQSFWGRHRIGRVPVLLYVLDAQPQQLAGLESALNVLGVEYERVTTLPTDLSRYASVWIFCGVHPNQQPLSSQAAQRITTYLNDGGACYWEGGDVWAFDYQTALHPLFGIDGVSDGSGDAGPIEGVRGRLTEGMAFTYGGENSFIDRIRARGAAFSVLNNARSGAVYALCVANASENYRTVGSSIELGALHDGQPPSTRVHLIRGILEWFNIPVLHDLSPPVITHVPLGVWHNGHRPIPIFADVQDDSEIEFVACDYRVNGSAYESIMLQSGASGYLGYISAQSVGSRILYRLRAADRSSPQNTTVTDEYQLDVRNFAERVANLIPSTESLNWSRKRGSNGTLSISNSMDNQVSVVLMGGEEGRVATYITESQDLSGFSNPELVFCSKLAGQVRRQPAAARILASTDGGETFPHLLWRENLSVDGHRVWVREGNLTMLANQDDVIVKFVYYADSYWEISRAQFRESKNSSSPVRNLVVVPGATISLHWSPASEPGAAYRILAAPTLFDEFVQIAIANDTTFTDEASAAHVQRFYRVLQIGEPEVLTGCDSEAPMFDRIAKSYRRRAR